jgi:hypothetical protein
MSSYLEEVILAPADRLPDIDAPDLVPQPLEIINDDPEDTVPVSEEDFFSEPRKIRFSPATEQELRNKFFTHNAAHGSDISKKADIRAIRAAYRRGAGAFTASGRADFNRHSWAMARVDAFLGLLASGRPANSSYTYDNDLLPASHPKSAKRNAESLSDATAAVSAATSNSLVASITAASTYSTDEHAIFALAEYSGLGYEVIPAIRAAWNRADASEEGSFQRAYELAANLYNSKDADLLPAQETIDG